MKKTIVAITTILPTASASICFWSSKSSDYYKLNCGFTGQESSLIQLLSTCNIKVGDWYCPSYSWWNYYITSHFGTGYFGGAACDLVHSIYPGDCVIKVLEANVKSNIYGTYTDIAATTGIVAAGIVVVAAVSYGSYRFFHCVKNVAKANAVVAADERTRLINDDASATAPSKVAPVIDDNELAVIVNHAGP